MMFVDASARAIVANERDAKGLLHEESGLWVGKLAPEDNPANTAVQFGGKRWSMVLWPVSDNRYARQRLLMHESFHRIQNDIGLPMSNPSNAHLPRPKVESGHDSSGAPLPRLCFARVPHGDRHLRMRSPSAHAGALFHQMLAKMSGSWK